MFTSHYPLIIMEVNELLEVLCPLYMGEREKISDTWAGPVYIPDRECDPAGIHEIIFGLNALHYFAGELIPKCDQSL
jgi:hypothetical protein